MARLGNLKPVLGALPPRLTAQRDEHGHSRQAEPWRKWYSTARWQVLRWSILVRDMFTCQRPACRALVGDTSQLVADHIVPHRGDPALFWDPANLQTLCKPCHDGLKQAEERRGPPRA
jgi:5-methylcytosine-specific restriction protein A